MLYFFKIAVLLPILLTKRLSHLSTKALVYWLSKKQNLSQIRTPSSVPPSWWIVEWQRWHWTSASWWSSCRTGDRRGPRSSGTLGWCLLVTCENEKRGKRTYCQRNVLGWETIIQWWCLPYYVTDVFKSESSLGESSHHILYSQDGNLLNFTLSQKRVTYRMICQSPTVIPLINMLKTVIQCSGSRQLGKSFNTLVDFLNSGSTRKNSFEWVRKR